MEKFNIEEIKEQEVNSDSGIFTIIFGNPGVGKSCMASTYPDPLLLDFEGSASNIPNLKRIKIDMGNLKGNEDTRDKPFLEVADISKQFLQSNKYKTLVLDGGLELMKISQDYTVKRLGRKSIRDMKFGDTYIDARDCMDKLFKNIIGKGKNIVLICHTEEVTEVDSKTDEEFIIKRPLIGDKIMVFKLPALSNIVGRVEIDGDGNRKFNCVPTDRSVLKNQYNIRETIEPNWDSLKQKIDLYYKEVK